MDMERHTIETPESATELDVEQAGNLFIQSFRFSQGEVELQEDIFRFLHEIHPEWRMSDDFREKVYAESIEKIKNIVFASSRRGIPGGPKNNMHTTVGTTHPQDRAVEVVKGGAKEELRQMQGILNGDGRLGDTDAKTGDDLIQKIAYSMLIRDINYLKKGRSISYLRHFAFDSRSTSIPEYDLLFRKVGEYLGTVDSQPKISSKLTELKNLTSRPAPKPIKAVL